MTSERIFKYVEKTETCWLWRGYIKPDGYGDTYLHGRTVKAHRAVYELMKGEIPEGLHLDHLCRVRHCVNPEHLEPVTNAENILRSPIHWAAINARKTHCIRNHDLSITGRREADGHRVCTECKRIRALEYRAQGRSAESAAAWRHSRVTCPECGIEVARSSLTRHLRRRHQAEGAVA